MKIKSSLFLLFLCVFISTVTLAQENKSSETVQWLKFEDAVESNTKNPKKIFIDMYTNWCGWCKKMDATTFTDPAVASYLNKHFYSVKLNAETKDSIFFKDKYFQYKPEYKSNEMAAIMMNGKMSYPTSVYLDGESNLIGPVPGYLTAEQFLPILKYFAEDFYKTTNWEDYMNSQSK